MRQPKRHFPYHAGTAVYLDATVGPLKPCRSGCARDHHHMCIHRFGPAVYVIAQQDRIAFTRLSDLQVILDFLYIITARWKNGATGVWNRRYVILTNDRGFVQSAERSYRQKGNTRKFPLRFLNDCVVHPLRGFPWEIKIEVHTIPEVATNPPDNRHDAALYALMHLSS